MTLKKKYNDLRKRYNLPSYDEINANFSIEDIDDDSELILTNIRIKIFEKIEFFTKLIESMLQPDTVFTSMYEARYISDEEKKEAYNLFKRLTALLRYATLVSINNEEEDNAKFINGAYELWCSVKKEMQKHIQRLCNVWKKETDISEDLSYFG